MQLISNATIFSTALLAGLLLQPMVIRYAKRNNLKEANDERKTHTEQVSNLGGIGIAAAFFMALVFMISPSLNSPLMAFTLALPLFAVSLYDDIQGAGVTLRFVVQAVLGIGLYEMGFQILNLEGLWLLNLSANVFLVMLMVNAFNLIDGINGLAGSLGLFGSVVFGAMLAAQGKTELSLACFAYGGALAGFLFYNFGKKARIFMGDNGSTVLGFFMALMAMAALKPATGGELFSDKLPLVLSVIAVPVVDVFKVALMRLAKMKSPFSPDRTHIHHLLTDGLLSHPAACAVLLGWTLALAGIAIKLPELVTPVTVPLLAIAPYLLAKMLRFLKQVTSSTAVAPPLELPAMHSLSAS